MATAAIAAIAAALEITPGEDHRLALLVVILPFR
jgi:hypothetical protein